MPTTTDDASAPTYTMSDWPTRRRLPELLGWSLMGLALIAPAYMRSWEVTAVPLLAWSVLWTLLRPRWVFRPTLVRVWDRANVALLLAYSVAAVTVALMPPLTEGTRAMATTGAQVFVTAMMVGLIAHAVVLGVGLLAWPLHLRGIARLSADACRPLIGVMTDITEDMVETAVREDLPGRRMTRRVFWVSLGMLLVTVLTLAAFLLMNETRIEALSR